MVSAELQHNPYLLETAARFNGRSPKVNSAIERFEGRSLVKWVDEVPDTFRDEMNGLDFDLYFTGTDADYQKVLNAFLDQGIDAFDATGSEIERSSNKRMSSNSVRLFHKESLEDVSTKRGEISELLEWFSTHRNRRFDRDQFIAAHSEALDGSVPYIIVNENSIQLDLPSVSAETVNSAQSDLASTELTSTPILFMVNPRNSAQFRSDLLYLLNRPDVEQRQLFFLIHPSMNVDRAIRVISDLGVDEPQIVSKPDDSIVIQYLDDYPSMRYVRRTAAILRKLVNTISVDLQEADEESVVTSANRGRIITQLDRKMEQLANTRKTIQETSQFMSQDEIDNLCEHFESNVQKWHNKKTTVTGQEQIWKAAGEFDFDLRGWVTEIESGIAAIMQAEQDRIETTLATCFSEAVRAPIFKPNVERPSILATVVIPNVIEALINKKQTEQVNPKNDFFGLFGQANQGDGIEYVEVASFETWRSTVLEMLMPRIQEVIEGAKRKLSDYHAATVVAYSRQLDNLIKRLIEEKESVIAELSDDERMLEEDKAWLQEFENRLLAIERN